MNYDDIFGEEIYETYKDDIAKDYNDLVDIFEKNGFDKQLTTLTLASHELIELSTLYKENREKDTSERNYKRLIQSMAIVHSLLETFISADDEIFDIVEEVRKKYIEKELCTVDQILGSSSNRIAYLLKNKTL